MKKKDNKETLNEVVEENIIDVSYCQEMTDSVLDYSMSSIVRAIPDARDGFKPVHRRILYTMYIDGTTHDKQYKKSVKTVGQCLAKFHPHGDSAVYESLVRMSQDFKMLIPLVDLHGNGGSIDGDTAAAMRYTEARLAKISQLALLDLDKQVVKMVDNFDNTELEPDVLPVKFPQLLINGSQGIAVGMATNIPSHNPLDVKNVVDAYLDNNKITASELADIIQGPDYPTGAQIINPKEFKNFYINGSGKTIIRAKIEIEDGDYGKVNIVVTEIPISVSGNKQKLINDIISLMRDKHLPELSDCRDESSKDGIRIVLETKRGTDIPALLSKLYKKTSLESTEGYNFLTIVDKKPMTLNLKEYIEVFIEHQHSTIINKYKWLLQKAENRKEVLDGLVKAIDVIDCIIEVVRGSKQSSVAKECLMTGKCDDITFVNKETKKIAKGFNFSQLQATAIMGLRLQQLSGLELHEIIKERDDLIKDIKKCNDYIKSKAKRETIIRQQMQEFVDSVDTKRKTVLEEVAVRVVEPVQEKQKYMFIVDKTNYVKKILYTNYIKQMANNQVDQEFKYELEMEGHADSLISFFDVNGNLTQVKFKQIPDVNKVGDKGTPIDNIEGIDLSKMILVCQKEEAVEYTYVIHTKNGFVKVMDGKEFETNRVSTKFTNVDEDDYLILFEPIVNGGGIGVKTNKGQLRYLLDEVPQLKKAGRGVKSVSLKEKEYIQSVKVLSQKQINSGKLPINKRAKATK